MTEYNRPRTHPIAQYAQEHPASGRANMVEKITPVPPQIQSRVGNWLEGADSFEDQS